MRLLGPQDPQGSEASRLSLSHCFLAPKPSNTWGLTVLGVGTAPPPWGQALLRLLSSSRTIRVVKDGCVLDKGDIPCILSQAPATQEAKAGVSKSVPASVPAPWPTCQAHQST